MRLPANGSLFGGGGYGSDGMVRLINHVKPTKKSASRSIQSPCDGVSRPAKHRQTRDCPVEPSPMEIEVDGDFITLGQLLKVAGLIATGGETKLFLENVAILVNGEPENRRGRKLRPQDKVEIEGEDEAILLVAPRPRVRRIVSRRVL